MYTSIMTLRTLESTDVFHLHHRLILAVQFHKVVVVGVAFRVHGGLAMAVNAPAHGEQSVLLYDIHRLDRTMTGLTDDACYINML